MLLQTFQAFRVQEEADGRFTRCLAERNIDDLPPGDVLIRVRYSSLNYKDALSADGHKGVTRKFPHTPGIDAAGTVESSDVPAFKSGDEVVVTGYDLGMNTSGGLAQYIRVPAEWVVAKPANLTLRQTMVLGTAGFTAGLCLHRLETHGLTPDAGAVVVTGATGGVGSLSIALLAHLGYQAVAVTGKADQSDFLKDLGASEVILRDAFMKDHNRPLLSPRWAGGIDTAGGDILATILKSLKFDGAVAACGLAASHELNTSVYPFLLRAVSVLGVASAESPMPLRLQIWQKLAGPWNAPVYQRTVREISLGDVEACLMDMLAGKAHGRVVVRID